jgi:hypothetical protein
MKKLTNWLQTNPIVVLVMFIVSMTSGIAGLLLGWKQLYVDFLSKSVELPAWLIIIIVFAVLPALILVRRKTEVDENAKLLSVQGQKFGVQRLFADGKSFERCEFHGTEIVFHALQSHSFINCQFSGIRLSFGGPAARTVAMLVAWSKDAGGFQQFVDQLISDVRSGTLPEAVPPGKF